MTSGENLQKWGANGLRTLRVKWVVEFISVNLYKEK